MEIQHKICLAVLLISVLSLSYSISNAQVNDRPCSYTESSQLDFWVGTWDLSWKDPDGSERKGTNVINKILGGCVIEENFNSGDKSGLIGRSYSVYNPVKKIWQQTWIDNSGAYLDLTGGMDGDKMILWRKTVNKAGKEMIQRMVFYEITQNSFYWNWENSTDDGKTWNLVWKIQYSRKA
jgi:hypothetical protein